MEFKSKANGQLALGIADWLVSRKFACALRQSDDGVITITYAAEDGSIWPSIRVDAGKIVFPSGTLEDLIFQFLAG